MIHFCYDLGGFCFFLTFFEMTQASWRDNISNTDTVTVLQPFVPLQRKGGLALERVVKVQSARSALQKSNYISELHAGAADSLYADKVAAVYV